LSCREGQSISNSANENERNRFENQINEHCSASAHSHQGKIEATKMAVMQRLNTFS
jgi:hypothetical protein